MKLSSIGLQYRLPRCYDITQYFGTGDYWRPSSLVSRKACFGSPMQACSCDEKDNWCSYVSRSWTWSWQVIPFMLISDNHFLRHSWWKLQPPLYQFLTSVTSSEQVPFHIFEIHSISHTNYWVWLHNGLWPGQYKLMTGQLKVSISSYRQTMHFHIIYNSKSWPDLPINEPK